MKYEAEINKTPGASKGRPTQDVGRCSCGLTGVAGWSRPTLSTPRSLDPERARHASHASCRSGSAGNEGRVDLPVKIEWTPCNYGGTRPWFLCPRRGCGRRVAILYCDSDFGCRTCRRLTYNT